MANIINISQTNTFEEWRTRTNELGSALGDLDNINSNNETGEDNVVDTLNNLRSETTNNALWIGQISNLFVDLDGTVYNNLTDALNATEDRLIIAENEIGDITTIYNSGSLTNLTDGVNEVYSNLQNVSSIIGVAMAVSNDAVTIETFNDNYDGDSATVIAALNKTYARLNKFNSLVGGTQSDDATADFAADDLYGTHTSLVDAINGIEGFALSSTYTGDGTTLVGALNDHDTRLDNFGAMHGATTKATFKSAFNGNASIETTLGALNNHESRLDTEEDNVDALQGDVGTWSTYENLMTSKGWEEDNITDAIIDIRERQDNLTGDFVDASGDQMTGDLTFDDDADIYGVNSITVGVGTTDTINIDNLNNVGIGKEADTVDHSYTDENGNNVAVASWKVDVNGTVNASNLRISGQQLDDRFQPRTITDGVSVVTDTVEQQGNWSATGKVYIGLGTDTDTSGNLLPLKVSDPDATTGFTFTEFLQDTTGGMFTDNTEGGGISAVYDDASGKITLAIADDSHNHVWSNIDNATETVQDIIGDMISANTENGISVSYNDADAKLNFDVDDFDITLTGDVTGSGTVTNLGDVSFAATIQPNSVALATDTTGDFVKKGATSGNGISGSTTGENKTFTVSSNATSTNTTETIVYRNNNKAFNISTINVDTELNVTKAISVSGNDHLLNLKGTLGDIGANPTGIGINFEIEDGNNTPGASADIRMAVVNDTDYGDNDERAGNLIFATSNDGTLSDKMIITGDGRFGFNVVNPTTDFDIGGDVKISGDLIINGTTTTINTETVTLHDNIIVLNSNSANTPTENGGIEIERGNSTNASFTWIESGDYWKASNQFRVDNIKLDGNTISATNGNGSLTVSCPGTGVFNVSAAKLDLDDVTTVRDNNLGNGQLYIGTGGDTTRATLSEGEAIDITNGSGSITIAAEKATSSNLGVATFNTDNFTVSTDGDVTIKNDGVILGTETTGNYVKKGTTSGNGISGSCDSEGGTFTVTSDATSDNTASTIVFRDSNKAFHATTINSLATINAADNALTIDGTSLKLTDSTYTNHIKLLIEKDTAKIADTFTDSTTDKSYIHFAAGDGSNDPGYIMHETSERTSSPDERNEGVLHLCPSDDNSGIDYVSIHGTDDVDQIKLFTSGVISGVTSLDTDVLYAGNIKTSSNTITSANTNGSITIDPSGTGQIYFKSHVNIPDGDIYLGKNSGGDSAIHLYDDNTNTWCTLKWDDSSDELQIEDNSGISRTIYHSGNIPSYASSSHGHTFGTLELTKIKNADQAGTNASNIVMNVDNCIQIKPDSGTVTPGSLDIYPSGGGNWYTDGGKIKLKGGQNAGAAGTVMYTDGVIRLKNNDMYFDIDAGFNNKFIFNNTIDGTIFMGESTSARYADLAENYQADADYEVGTVLSLGGDWEVTQSNADMDRRIIGVVSTAPAYLMNSEQQGSHVTPVALTGRVPCKVTGNIKAGDMLVSNGDGTARAEEAPRMGSVIGKALSDSEGTNVIEVVVGKL